LAIPGYDMKGILEAVTWGVIQGLTEFIPVSSSGHLVLIPRFLEIGAPNIIFTIFLHVGTLLAVVIFFRKALIMLFTKERRLGLLVLTSTIPIFICGLLFADKIKMLFDLPRCVGYMLIINGAIIIMAHIKSRLINDRPPKSYSFLRTFIIGIAQAFALLPGISRSGITITAGMYGGLNKKEAYRFSFFLFVPAILLAITYSVKEMAVMEYAFSFNMIIGTIVSAVCGILALKFLLFMLMKARLYILGVYSVILGIFSIIIF